MVALQFRCFYGENQISQTIITGKIFLLSKRKCCGWRIGEYNCMSVVVWCGVVLCYVVMLCCSVFSCRVSTACCVILLLGIVMFQCCHVFSFSLALCSMSGLVVFSFSVAVWTAGRTTTSPQTGQCARPLSCRSPAASSTGEWVGGWVGEWVHRIMVIQLNVSYIDSDV